MPEWTTSQRQAFESRNKTLLVSAGAGSGKTTVLTQRLIKRIQESASVTDFLVVTFTKASASDLSEKLYEALQKLVAENPSNGHYRNQLYLLPDAAIGTISAFCLDTIRSYFQIIGLSPNFRIADQQEAQMLASDAMQQAIEEGYETAGESFLRIADTFSGEKNDNPLEQKMLDLYSRLRAYSDYFGWLKDCGEGLLSDAEHIDDGLFSTAFGKKIQNFLYQKSCGWKRRIDNLIVEAQAASSGSSTMESLGQLKDNINLLVKASHGRQEDFLAAINLVCSSKYARFTNNTAKKIDIKRKAIREEIEKAAKWFAQTDCVQLRKQFRETGEIVLAIRDFLKRFEEIYVAAKRDRNVIDFSDTEHYLLQLLEKDGQPTDICKSLKEHYKEIFIDEYQDVSPLQDRIFCLLSSESNRFMVGDVKQSIYRFRNAYPDIFLGYKERFPDFGMDDGPCARIFLRENFRSGKMILQFVNCLFKDATAGTEYEREYRGEELVYANEKVTACDPVTIAYAVDDSKNGIDAVSLEAEYIAGEIHRLVSEKDEDGKQKYAYGDIVLLFNALSNGHTDAYEDAFRKHGIPYEVSKSQLFFNQPEVLLALGVLRAIDDPSDDVSLFGMMRSPIFGFNSEDVYQIRSADMSGPLYRAVKKAAEEDSSLGSRCRNFMEQIDSFRHLAEGKTCFAFLWELYVRTGMLYISSENGRNNLLMLYEYARTYESTGYKGLSGFLAYLKTAEEKQVELPGSGAASSTECVQMTTIHKSKGLEYPVVFFCNCGSRPGGGSAAFTMLRDDGLFFNLKDYDALVTTETVLHSYADRMNEKAEYGELLRKIYVACTRAKEKLYITGKMSKTKAENRAFDNENPSSIMELMMHLTETEDESFRVVPIVPEMMETWDNHLAEAQEASAIGYFTDEVKEALLYQYPYPEQHAAKVSVSELKERNNKIQSAYKKSQLVRPPKFLAEEKTSRDAATAGTANHIFLQFCDFEKVAENGIESEANRLVANRWLSEYQASLLDYDGLHAFFGSGLFARIRKSKSVHREQMFSVRLPDDIIGCDGSEFIVLNGLIDCYFEEDDGSLTIVDYKTDHVKNPQDLIDRYAIQLRCYKRALAETTGRNVGKLVIWSFALDKEIET